MNIHKSQLNLGLSTLPHGISSLPQWLNTTLDSELRFWDITISTPGSWRNVHEESYPEKEIDETIKLWQSTKMENADLESLYKSLDVKSEPLDERKKRIANQGIYLTIVEPSIEKICELLDKLLLNNKGKASVYASWVYTYGISRLGLTDANTKLKQEISKRFSSIEIAPKLKHCCVGLCSACGRKEIVYSCTNS